jgi:hypothetical protein
MISRGLAVITGVSSGIGVVHADRFVTDGWDCQSEKFFHVHLASCHGADIDKEVF